METINQRYLPQVNKILIQHFPEYFKKVAKEQLKPKAEREKVDIISQEEINILHGKYHNEGDIAARDRLIYSQLRLVCYYSYKYFMEENKTQIEVEDLLGFANQILVKLIEKYDPYKDKKEGEYNKLPSFIRTWLGFHLHKKQKDFGLAIHLPHNQINDQQLVDRYETAFQKRYGREPFYGEYLEIKENTKKHGIVTRRVHFNHTEKHLLVEWKVNGVWEEEKTIKIPNNRRIVSGNLRMNPFGDSDNYKTEIFDIIKGDYDIPLDDDKNLLSLQIKEVLTKLTKREQESIEYVFHKDEPLHNIPALLTPDYSCKKEVNSLKHTSLNILDIYIKKNGEEIKLRYNIVVNNHVVAQEEGLQEHSEVEMLSHSFKNIKTNIGFDEYRFKVEGADEIRVVHETCGGKTEIEATYDGRIMNFSVNYHYGVIFATQTFLNNKRKLINKLRKELKYLKNAY